MTKKCTAEKELNPKTKRCVKRCNLGYKRNENFKCVKKTRKLPSVKSSSTEYSSIKPLTMSSKTKTLKNSCPEGKERNPKTNRCINRCKPGYSRNENFRCVKNKSN